MEKDAVYAKHKSARISPKKVAIVLDLIRGKDAGEAERILKFDKTKAAAITLKVLNSALGNARNNKGLNENDLYVSDARVDGGSMLKRGRISAKGRFNRILKRTSHITMGLSERSKK